MSEHEQPANPPADAGDSDARREPKVIKRYTNRKLYDTVESRYVTLDEIAQMIKGGAEVKIIDNRSKEDLTSVTLAQIIFEEEKKRSQMPLGVLREIIRHGGEAVAGFYNEKVGTKIAERISDVKSKTESLREEVESRVRGVTSVFRGDGTGAGPVKEVLQAGERAVDELRAKVDASVKQALDALGGPSALANELERLHKKIAELEKKLEHLSK